MRGFLPVGAVYNRASKEARLQSAQTPTSTVGAVYNRAPPRSALTKRAYPSIFIPSLSCSSCFFILDILLIFNLTLARFCGIMHKKEM